MKICHRYRKVIDDSLDKRLDMKEWDSYNTNDEDCVMYVHKNDNNKLAVKKVKGLFATEIAYTFWNIDDNVKLEWDQSVQSMKVLEVLSPNCAIVHLKMKRIWPAQARDCVCATEILQIGEGEWVVNNVSVEHPLADNIGNDYVRMTCDLNMFVKEELIDASKPKVRDNIISTITFRADINVGNWISNVVVNNMCHSTLSNSLDELCNYCIKKK